LEEEVELLGRFFGCGDADGVGKCVVEDGDERFQLVADHEVVRAETDNERVNPRNQQRIRVVDNESGETDGNHREEVVPKLAREFSRCSISLEREKLCVATTGEDVEERILRRARNESRDEEDEVAVRDVDESALEKDADERDNSAEDGDEIILLMRAEQDTAVREEIAASRCDEVQQIDDGNLALRDTGLDEKRQERQQHEPKHEDGNSDVAVVTAEKIQDSLDA